LSAFDVISGASEVWLKILRSLKPQGDHGSKKTTPSTGSPFETMLSEFINSSRPYGRNLVGAKSRTAQAYI
jgi:hypothetical protein